MDTWITVLSVHLVSVGSTLSGYKYMLKAILNMNNMKQTYILNCR